MDRTGHVSKKRGLKPNGQDLSDPLLKLKEVDVLELLESDSRPTFIIKIGGHASSSGPSAALVYFNKSLESAAEILNQIQSLYRSDQENEDLRSIAFREWTAGQSTGFPYRSSKRTKTFAGVFWTLVTMREHWRLISGVPENTVGGPETSDLEASKCIPEEVSPSGGPTRALEPDLTGRQAQSSKKKLDWTRGDFCHETTSHIKWVRSFNWESTLVGSMEVWPDQLRLAANMLMADPSPAVVYWGEELTLLYDEAFIPIFHSKHPWGLGRPFAEVYTNVGVALQDFYDSIWATGRQQGQATAGNDQRFITTMHNDRAEEVYFSYRILPILGNDECVGGFYVTFNDVTRSVLASRRATALRATFDTDADGIDPQTFWRKMIEPLAADEYDIVSVFAYSVPNVRPTSSNANLPVAETIVLEAFSAVPMDDRGVPYAHALMRKDNELMNALAESLRSGAAQIFDISDPDVGKNLIPETQTAEDQNVPKRLALCPTDPTLTSRGILVLGVHPLRPCDEDYQSFVANLSRNISASLAASDRARFAQQAILESELRFSQMTATSPAAHFEVNLEGQILYVNERWHSITGMPRPGHEMPAMSWLQLVYEPDLPMIQGEWIKLLEGKSVSFELRMKKEWQAINPFSGDTLDLTYTWVLAMASQHESKNGPTVMGCLVDINRQKWAEDFHKKKTEEAIEMKCQQERFIDMTSHEMRNPLSAIFQCSDSIVSLLEDAMQSFVNGDACKGIGGLAGNDMMETLKNSIDAAQTISLCAQHQKRIVDDVLMLSKMDANMIEVTPVDSNPKQLIEKGLSIFASELRANATAMEFCVDKSYNDLDIEWVRMDPSRLLQILINLTTNALKFTISEERERKIAVSLGASRTPPSQISADEGFAFLPHSDDVLDPTQRPEWGSGEPVYLIVSVTDNGRGISETEMKELFIRFKQASPRTHIQYGGSGLGLHIARQLTEMQAGQIGFTSERGKGSIFSFYVKVRRSNPTDLPLPITGAATMALPGWTTSPTIAMPGEHQIRSNESQPDTASPKELAKLNILVVEDNLVNQRVLSKQLQRLGWKVSVANHGLEALDALKRTSFWNASSSSGESRRRLDLVLMDIEMPIMDGLTATRHIRKLQVQGSIIGHVPIIAVSANARSEQILKATTAGVDDVVSKPFRIPQLVTKIEQLLASRSP